MGLRINRGIVAHHGAAAAAAAAADGDTTATAAHHDIAAAVATDLDISTTGDTGIIIDPATTKDLPEDLLDDAVDYGFGISASRHVIFLGQRPG